ncbi:small multi-drug export protein [Candidatus Falkowbacteria bacterium]|nr:small multi-drug export protein [Candidatus Falkowbacteria bacterium]
MSIITSYYRELLTLALAATPIIELRGALPVALTVYGMSIPKAYILSVVGNMLPILPILLLLEPISNFLRKHFKVFERFFTWLFARTRSKFVTSHEKYGAIALIIFIAIPLPATGAWTGAVAAWLFGIKPVRAFLYALAGVAIAGVIVTILTLGVSGVLN